MEKGTQNSIEQQPPGEYQVENQSEVTQTQALHNIPGHSKLDNVQQVEDVDPEGPNATFHSKTLILVAAICFIYFAQLFNVVGSGAFGRDITAVVGGGDIVVWFTSIIAIATVALSPPISQAADYWGRKWFVVVLTAAGTVGTIIISRANSPGMAIGGFVISSLSFGAQCLLFTVVSEVLPRKYRSWAQATLNIGGCLGGIVGLLAGGALTNNGHHIGFRTYFYIDAGIYAIAAVGCLLCYNPPPRELQVTLNFRQKIRKLDWIGYALLDFGLVLFCIGLSWSQNPYDWTNAHILAPFLIGVALIAAFVFYETWIITDGLVHHGLFQNRNFPLSCVCLFVEGLVFFAVNSYMPLEASVLYGADSMGVSLHVCIFFFSLLVFSLVAGYLPWKTKTIRIPATASFVFFVIFFVLMATISSSTPEANLWGYTVFSGLSLALCLISLVTTAQLSTPLELISTTTGLLATIRNLGGAIGLAVFNAILNHGTSTNIGPKVAEAVLPLGLPDTSIGDLITGLASGDTAGLAAVPGVTANIIAAAGAALVDAYAVSLRYVWVAAGCFAAAALIASLFLFDPTHHFNEHIDAPAEIGTTALNDKSVV